MKKIIILLLVLLPIVAVSAKKRNTDDSKYLKGAVPEENGVVVFRKTFKVPTMTEVQLHKALYSYVKDSLVARSIQDAYARMLTDETDTLICGRVEEWMVFQKMFLYLDQTRIRYQINVTVKGHKVDMSISQISFYYDENWNENKPTGQGGERLRAEEWINDKNALNKAGTKLQFGSAKFRRHTVDRMNQIFDKAMDMLENRQIEKKKQENPKVEVKKRQFIDE